MIATSHVIIGGSVGLAVGLLTHSPIAALAAGIATHFICDSIPHMDHPPSTIKDGELVWSPAVWIFAIGDSLVAAIVVLALWHFKQQESGVSRALLFVLGAIGGYLPDFIDNVPFWNKFTQKLPGITQMHRLHAWTHNIWSKRYPMPRYAVLGITTQIIAVGLSLFYLFHR